MDQELVSIISKLGTLAAILAEICLASHTPNSASLLSGPRRGRTQTLCLPEREMASAIGATRVFRSVGCWARAAKVKKARSDTATEARTGYDLNIGIN